MSTIRAQVLRLAVDEHEALSPTALDGLLGQQFLGGIVTQAWLEDGWIMVEAEDVDVVPPPDLRGLSIGHAAPEPVVTPFRRPQPSPPPWREVGRLTSLNGTPVTDERARVYIAPVGTPPPGTTER